MKAKNAPARKKVESDFVQKRIATIYAGLSPAERAELLAAAERIADHGNDEISGSFPTSREIAETEIMDRNAEKIPVVRGKLLIDITDEVTQTPRGKVEGNKFFHVQIRCPNEHCQGLFYVPKIRLGRKTACPFCGQHVVVK